MIIYFKQIRTELVAGKKQSEIFTPLRAHTQRKSRPRKPCLDGKSCSADRIKIQT